MYALGSREIAACFSAHLVKYDLEYSEAFSRAKELLGPALGGESHLWRNNWRR